MQNQKLPPEWDNSGGTQPPVGNAQQKRSKTLTMVLSVLLVIVVAGIGVLAYLYFSRDNAADTPVEDAAAQTRDERDETDETPAREPDPEPEPAWADGIGRTVTDLRQENPDLVLNVRGPGYDGEMSQVLGEEGGAFAYYFYRTNGFPSIEDLMEDGYGDQLICAGVYTSVGELFPQITGDVPLAEFFRMIGVENYTYVNAISNLLEFTYDGYHVTILYDAEIDEEMYYNGEWTDVPPESITRDNEIYLVDSTLESGNYIVCDAWRREQSEAEEGAWSEQTDEAQNPGLFRSDPEAEAVITLAYDETGVGYAYRVPQVTYDTPYARQANAEIAEKFETLAREMIQYLAEGNVNYCFEIGYAAQVTDGTLALIVYAEYFDNWTDYRVYNFDWESGDGITNDMLLQRAGLTEEEFISRAKQCALVRYAELYENKEWVEEKEFELARQYTIELNESSISKDTMMYFDKDGTLYIITELGAPVGAGSYYEFVPIT